MARSAAARVSASGERPSGARPIVKVAFDGIRKPVEFRDCPEVLELLRQVLRGWRFAPTDSVECAALRISRSARAYRLEARWIDGAIREHSAVAAACSLIVDLVCAFLKDNPSLLCLHCGAAIFAGRAVVFPNTNRAGKSTLISRLAAENIRIVADDIMPVTAEDGHCLALGIAPRPRIPLPAHASRPFRDFVRRHAGPGDDRYQYLRLPEGDLCGHGERVPLGAIVTLERRDGAPATLRRAHPGEALRTLVSQNFAREEPAPEILRRLHALVDTAQTMHLRYSDLDEAAALLGSTFSAWPPMPAPAAPVAMPASATRRRIPCGSPYAAVPRGRAGAACAFFIRHPGVESRSLDGGTFLTDPACENILHLDPIGSGIWNVVADPTSAEAVTDIVGSAFPQVPRAQLAADVTTLLENLLAAGLVRVVWRLRR